MHNGSNLCSVGLNFYRTISDICIDDSNLCINDSYSCVDDWSVSAYMIFNFPRIHPHWVKCLGKIIQ